MDHSTHEFPVVWCKECIDGIDATLISRTVTPNLANLFKHAQQQGLVEPQHEYASN